MKHSKSSTWQRSRLPRLVRSQEARSASCSWQSLSWATPRSSCSTSLPQVWIRLLAERLGRSSSRPRRTRSSFWLRIIWMKLSTWQTASPLSHVEVSRFAAPRPSWSKSSANSSISKSIPLTLRSQTMKTSNSSSSPTTCVGARQASLRRTMTPTTRVRTRVL